MLNSSQANAGRTEHLDGQLALSVQFYQALGRRTATTIPYGIRASKGRGMLAALEDVRGVAGGSASTVGLESVRLSQLRRGPKDKISQSAGGRSERCAVGYPEISAEGFLGARQKSGLGEPIGVEVNHHGICTNAKSRETLRNRRVNRDSETDVPSANAPGGGPRPELASLRSFPSEQLLRQLNTINIRAKPSALLQYCTISATCASSETTVDDWDTDQARRKKRHFHSRA